MGRFVNDQTGIVVSVDDSKDDRFASGWSAAEENGEPTKKTASKRAASTKSDS